MRLKTVGWNQLLAVEELLHKKNHDYGVKQKSRNNGMVITKVKKISHQCPLKREIIYQDPFILSTIDLKIEVSFS